MNFTFVGDLVMGTRATKMISVLSQKNSLQGRGTHDNKNETSLVFVFCTHCKNWPKVYVPSIVHFRTLLSFLRLPSYSKKASYCRIFVLYYCIVYSI